MSIFYPWNLLKSFVLASTSNSNTAGIFTGKITGSSNNSQFFVSEIQFICQTCAYIDLHIFTHVYIMYIIWLVVSIDACFHISLFKTIGILNPNWRAKRNHQRVNFAFFFIFKTLSETLLEVLHKHSEIIRSCFRKVHHQKTPSASDNLQYNLVSCIYCSW